MIITSNDLQPIINSQFWLGYIVATFVSVVSIFSLLILYAFKIERKYKKSVIPNGELIYEICHECGGRIGKEETNKFSNEKEEAICSICATKEDLPN